MRNIIISFILFIVFSGCITIQIPIPIQQCRQNFAVIYMCDSFDSNEFNSVMYMLKKANATITKVSDSAGLCHSIDPKYKPDINFSQLNVANTSGFYLVNSPGLLNSNEELEGILIQANSNNKPIAVSELGILFLARAGIIYARHSAPVRGYEQELKSSNVIIVERNIVKDKNILTNLDTQYVNQLSVKLVNEVC